VTVQYIGYTHNSLEQEAERKVQEFSQKIEELSRGHDLELESLVHISQLKQDDAEVRYFHNENASIFYKLES